MNINFLNIKNQIILFDAAIPWQMGFQDPATPVMEGIINFHHDLVFFLVLIVVFVSWILGRCIFFLMNPNAGKYVTFLRLYLCMYYMYVCTYTDFAK